MDLPPTRPVPQPDLLRPAAHSDDRPAGAADGRAAREFEHVFLAQVVSTMLETGGIETFGGGHAEEMWRSQLADALAGELVDQGGVGLADSVRSSISAYERAKQA